MFSRLEERTGFLEAVSGQHANTYAPQPEQERSYVENARCCGFGGFCPNEPRGGGGLSLPPASHRFRFLPRSRNEEMHC